MSNFSVEENMVRVDFFKQSGRWYTVEAVRWTGNFDGCIIDAFKQSLRDHFKDRSTAYQDMDAVCLHPYHIHSHPLCLRNGSWGI